MRCNAVNVAIFPIVPQKGAAITRIRSKKTQPEFPGLIRPTRGPDEALFGLCHRPRSTPLPHGLGTRLGLAGTETRL